MGYLIVFVLSIIISSNLYSQNKNIKSFLKSKKLLIKIYEPNAFTFYCGCSFKLKKPKLSSCGYIPKQDNERANRVEWEHVVPVSDFGHSFSEWKNGHPKCVNKKGKKYKGRKCAAKVNREFRLMLADMHNLFPAIGEVNGTRSNYPMSIIKGEERKFGECDFEIKTKKIEPRKTIRGDIARVYMYMDYVYPGRGIISEDNKKLFEIWNQNDPVDSWECERAKRIDEIQGNTNVFVKKGC